VDAVPVEEIGAGQQQLRDGAPVAGERFVIGFHQERLPDGRRRLLFVQQFRAAREADGPEARGDGAGGDKERRVAAVHQAGDFRSEEGHFAFVQAAVGGRQRAGTDFDDDGLTHGSTLTPVA